MVVPLALVAVFAGSCVDVRSEVDKRKDLKRGPVGDWPRDWLAREAGNPTDMGRPDRLADVAAGNDVPAVDIQGELPADDSTGDAVDQADAAFDGDVCVLQCEDKECGPDGCGDLCGFCPENYPVCSFGKCKKCKPDCGISQCGPDGCGGSCGTCPAKFNCLNGFCKAPACGEYQLLFKEDFSSCTQGAFDIIDFQPEDDVTWWALPLQATSEPCSLYMGDPETMSYFTGSSVHLKLLSPILVMPGAGAWRLTLSLFMETYEIPHPLFPYDYDVLFLSFLDNDTSQQEDLWSSKEILNTTEGEWMTLAVDISLLQGKTGRFILDFDTIDSVANDYLGIYLDDFKIETICPYCGEDADCTDDEPCTTDICLMFANFPTVGTCLFPQIEECCLTQPEEFCIDEDPCTDDKCDEQSGSCVHEPVPDCEPPDEEGVE